MDGIDTSWVAPRRGTAKTMANDVCARVLLLASSSRQLSYRITICERSHAAMKNESSVDAGNAFLKIHSLHDAA